MGGAADPGEYEVRLKKALQAMQQMRVRLDSLERMRSEPIAIIGMSCRFPGGADNPAAYWDLLRNGVDAISEVPPSRWDANQYYDPDPLAPGKTYTRSGGFLRSVDTFDAEFFGIAPREAMAMDPQQRMLLELSWEALEAAGQPADRLVGSRTGVYVGISTSDYSQFHVNSGETERIDAYSGTGVALSIAAGRVSYVYGFQGPNVAVDTFCSSSLVAIHLACRSLRQQESDMALAAGVNLILSPAGTVYSCKVRALAPDGRCKTFDASADGYGRGEGCGILVLKRLSDATAAGDNILAVIRGTAINHDGKSSGLTVPNGLSQQAVIRAALADGGVDSADVSYVEAHGTGTPLGDPIELRALHAAAAAKRTRSNPLIVGSAKTNIGHLEAAAGVAGVMKVALALENREIPAHLHLQEPNPHVPWDELPIEIPTKTRPWNTGEKRRIAGVSSFGFSGTNAHLIMEEAPAAERREPVGPRAGYLLPVSARTPEALTALVQSYRDLLVKDPGVSLHDLCYTASVRRSHHDYRAAFVATAVKDLAAQLSGFANKHRRAAEGVVFVFPGQIASESDTADEPAFREMRTRCQIAGAPELFASRMAHVALWKSWGIVPHMVVAEGAGEAAGSYAAGILTFDEAVSLALRDDAPGRDMKPNSRNGEVPFERVPAGGLGPAIEKLEGHAAVLEIGCRKPLDALADLYSAGIPVDWSPLYPSGGNVVSLPSYPWQRRRFWLDNVSITRAPREAAEQAGGHPLLGHRVLSPALTQIVFESKISASSPAYLKEHEVLGTVLFPASGFAEMALASGSELWGAQAQVTDLAIRESLPLSEGHTTTLQTVLSKESDGGAAFQIFSLNTDQTDWKLHATGNLSTGPEPLDPECIASIEARLSGEVSGIQFYEDSRTIGLQYGPVFQNVRKLRWNDQEALAEIEFSGADASRYTLHPAFFDSCLQALGAKLLAKPGSDVFLPSGIGSLRVLTPPDPRVFCHVSFLENAAPGTWEADLRILNHDGCVAVEVRRIVCRQAPKELFGGASKGGFRYVVDWREKESSFADEQGEPGLWIVLADAGGLGNKVCELLRRRDQQCVTVTAGESYSFAGGHAVVNPGSTEDFRQLIQEAPAHAGLPLVGFVHMWALDAHNDRMEHAVGSALHAVQAIGRAKLQEPPKFCLVTRGGQTLGTNAAVSPLQTSLAGLGRIVKVEHPNFHPVVVDLAPGSGAAQETRFLFEELLARNPEDLVAIRDGGRYVPRLQRDDGRCVRALGHYHERCGVSHHRRPGCAGVAGCALAGRQGG